MPASKAGLLIQKELLGGDDFAVLALYQDLGTCQVRRQRTRIVHVLAHVLSPSFSASSLCAFQLAK
jgi:hypothetical protein